MRVFVTGATGFIGSAIIPDLLDAGHQVLGLARSDASAQALIAAGAEVHRGDIEDLDSLLRGAAKADGVIHTAFNHDFSKFVANCEADRRVIEALGVALAGSGRPMIVTGGLGFTAPGRLATEDVEPATGPGTNPRAASAQTAAAAAARGARVMMMGLPQVHDTHKQGLITYLIATARAKGASAYVGDGSNRWPAAHRLDVAPLYRLALEQGQAGARYHAVAEEGVPFRVIAEVIARGLKVPLVALEPAQAPDHFGWMAAFAGLDMPASSALTRERLGWKPVQRGLIEDLEEATAFAG